MTALFDALTEAFSRVIPCGATRGTGSTGCMFRDNESCTCRQAARAALIVLDESDAESDAALVADIDAAVGEHVNGNAMADRIRGTIHVVQKPGIVVYPP